MNFRKLARDSSDVSFEVDVEESQDLTLPRSRSPAHKFETPKRKGGTTESAEVDTDSLPLFEESDMNML